MIQAQVEQLERQLLSLQDENRRLRAAALNERDNAARDLAASRDRYRTLFDSIDEGFCVIEFLDGPEGPLSDYIHIEANSAYARHTGIPNVVGQKVRTMVPLEADGWVELYRSVLLTGQPIRFERELVATRRHLELAAFRVEPESQRQVAVLFQDVTARKQAEAALRRLNESLEERVTAAIAERKLLADVVEGASTLVQVVDPDLRWIAINAAAARAYEALFGILPTAGDRLPDVLSHRPDALKMLASLWRRALGGETCVEIAEVADVSGLPRQYEVHVAPLEDSAGKRIGAYKFGYDVTDRRTEQERLRVAEEALRQSQKMEAVGQLTGGIAHDFNNMLAVVISSLRLTQRRLARGDHDIGELISSGMKGAERAANLVARLLAFSRQQPLSPENVDANALLTGMEDVLRRTIPESVHIDVVRCADLWPIHADHHGLESVVVNLAVNARDAMIEGGRLTLETANACLDDVYAAAHADVPEGQYVMIAVTDTGHGMSADVVARAFEPFFTTKRVGAGTGLGLSQVYGFVKQSGGHVKIYSEVGRGTSVKMYFPRLKETGSQTVAVAHAEHAPPRGEGQLVLVVEDDEQVRHLTVKCLAELGYATLEADGPVRALQLLDENAGIDLLMTDIVMPVMDGRQLADEVLRRKPGVRLLFATGYARNAFVQSGALGQSLQLISKPFTLETLADKVARALAAGSGA